MPLSAPHRSRATSKPAFGAGAGWIAALLIAVAIVTWNTHQHVRHYTNASAMYRAAVNPPEVDRGSPTGFSDGRRTMVYPSRWLDAQHWIMHTQQMLAGGEWRLRHVPDDNAPHGRSLHWAAPWRWWLGACAVLERILSGAPLGAAAERGALYANPALLALLLLVLVPLVARQFGAPSAAFLAFAVIGSPPLLVLFTPDNMDHHGLAQACAMISLFALLAAASGWTRNEGATPGSPGSWLPTPSHARLGFAISGIAGGFGLWISAAGTIPILGGIAVGAVASAWAGRSAAGLARFDPLLWRRWGFVGGATSLVCYLFEYFPSHLGWRLEVNHPLYAFAWIGGGEVLAQLTRRVGRPGDGPASREGLRLVAALIALAAPVVAILGWKERVFAVSDPFHLLLSRDYTPEGGSFFTALRTAGFTFDTIASCLPMLIVPGTALWLCRRRTSPLVRALLAVPLGATAVFWVLGLLQLRWWAVSAGLVLSVVVAGGALLTHSRVSSRRAALVWIGVTLLFAPGFFVTLQTASRSDQLVADDLFSLAERDLAHSLRLRVGSESPLVVLAAPATTSRLMYFASAAGLGTTFWENTEGLKRAAAIFGAPSGEEAHRLVREAGITHIVCLSWDDFVAAYVRLSRGLSSEQPINEPAFGLKLLNNDIPPPWLRRLPANLPQAAPLREHGALIFEVTDRTRREDVLVRAARDLLYRGRLSEARQLVPDLERYPNVLAVQVALARIQFAAQQHAAFRAALDRSMQLRSQLSAVEPEDRMDLVATLMVAGRGEEARAELDDALRSFDAQSIRTLTPGSRKILLDLTQRFGLRWPDSHLRDLAAQLMSPDGRI